MPLIFQHRIHRLDLVYNTDVLYVFGDNDQREGRGGQAAECRGAHNAVGIRTKKAPLSGPGVYYTDDEFEENCRKIDEDFAILFKAILERKTVVWPIDGIGTGYAQLDRRAPRTLRHIQIKLEALGNYEKACSQVDGMR